MSVKKKSKKREKPASKSAKEKDGEERNDEDGKQSDGVAMDIEEPRLKLRHLNSIRLSRERLIKIVLPHP